jgi:hypothetical protein
MHESSYKKFLILDFILLQYVSTLIREFWSRLFEARLFECIPVSCCEEKGLVLFRLGEGVILQMVVSENIAPLDRYLIKSLVTRHKIGTG